jgi:hypothetical protein
LLGRDARGRLSPSSRKMPLPTILEHVIVWRFVRLSEDAPSLLRVAAVMGQEWHFSTLEAVLQWEEGRLLAALETALASHVIVLATETHTASRTRCSAKCAMDNCC